MFCPKCGEKVEEKTVIELQTNYNSKQFVMICNKCKVNFDVEEICDEEYNAIKEDYLYEDNLTPTAFR